MSAPVRELSLRVLLQIEFVAVVSNHDGMFYAYAPQFDIWDVGEDFKGALTGMFDGLIGMLELVEERANIEEYLTSRGFHEKRKAYRTTKEKRKAAINEYIRDLEWEKDDPEKGKHLVVKVVLARTEPKLTHKFSQPIKSATWTPRYHYEETQKVAQATR